MCFGVCVLVYYVVCAGVCMICGVVYDMRGLSDVCVVHSGVYNMWVCVVWYE